MISVALVISYARKENSMRLVKQLILAGIERIYISIDGPRSDEIRDIQAKLKAELAETQINYSGLIQVWQREENMGSGASVIASLDWVFSREESCVIIEDDLIVTNQFFSFIKYGIQQMRDHENLKIVTGTNPFENVTGGRFGKVNYPVSWGWATNRENWITLRELIFSGATSEGPMTSFRKIHYWKEGRRRALSGQIEAWDVPLASEMCKTDYYTLIPPANLVSNIGFDQFAAHTSKSVWPLNLRTNELINLEDIKYTETQLVNLNENFENRIFKIRSRHASTWMINVIMDRFRFKGAKVTLAQRSQLENFPS